MTNTLAIAQRELRSYFFSAVAYVVMALFTFTLGLLFTLFVFQTDRPAEMETLFVLLIFVLIPTVPAISMRLISDELHRGTIETLMTSPVTDVEVVLGKWLGSLAFFAVMLLPTLLFVVVLEVWSNPDYGPIVAGYIGLLLVGAMMLAIGVFASALTRYQIIAFLLSALVITLFTVITWVLPRFVGAAAEPLVNFDWPTRLWALAGLGGLAVLVGLVTLATTRSAIGFVATALGSFVAAAAVWAVVMVVEARHLSKAIGYLNVSEHYRDFTKGLVDLSDIVYFLSGTALFLALAALVQESRRWR